jgi:transcription termination factor Rho
MPIVVLLDARHEEVSDWRRSVEAPIHASLPESSADAHVQIAQLALERAKRLAEQGIDVVLLLDSITRFARSHALSRPRFRRGRAEAEDGERDEALAIQGTRRFFASGRNTEEHGSLTMLCAVRAGSNSSMEEMVYDALSDSANLELRLRPELTLWGLWPALDVGRCQSRSEQAILSPEELEGLRRLRSRLAELSPTDAWRALVERIRSTGSNRELLLAPDRES